MRIVHINEVTALVRRLCIKANTWLPPDIAILLECASEAETVRPARTALEDIVENYKYAAESNLPICQDTGIAIVFADIGQDLHFTGGLFENAVNEGIRQGYRDGALRMSVVADPFRRENTGDNTPAVLYIRLVEGTDLKITVAPKGFGSENMSAMRMFLPSDTPDAVIEFLAETVDKAGAKPCPPLILGVGLGGSTDLAAQNAKRALMRPVDEPNSDSYYAAMERSALARINGLGIGAQGFGGSFTALAVNIEAAPTHIAGLPCVVCVGCHATRHAAALL